MSSPWLIAQVINNTRLKRELSRQDASLQHRRTHRHGLFCVTRARTGPRSSIVLSNRSIGELDCILICLEVQLISRGCGASNPRGPILAICPGFAAAAEFQAPPSGRAVNGSARANPDFDLQSPAGLPGFGSPTSRTPELSEFSSSWMKSDQEQRRKLLVSSKLKGILAIQESSG